MKETVVNKKITYSIVAVLLIVLVTIGATYAYFSAQASTDVQTVTTGTLTMGFTNGEIINATGITPINDNEIETKATMLPFSVTNTGNQHTKITIKLTDITIDDALKDIDFRWGLYNADKQDAAGTEMGVSFGIFKYSETGGEEILLQDVILDKNSATRNYKLRIWIHDDGALQNEMQGKTFSGKVVVTGEAIEYTPETCFTMDGGTITGYNAETCGTDVVIPKTINGTSVTKIGELENWSGVFESSGLTSVIIPDTVTTIEDMEFAGTFLTHITIPDSVTTIGESAFDGTSITYVTIPESVTTFQSTNYDDWAGSAFASTSLKSVVIPGSVSNLGMGTFWDASELTDVVLMDGIDKIHHHVFDGCNLTSIEIPSSANLILWFDEETGTESHIGASGQFLNNNMNEIIIRGKTANSQDVAPGWSCISFDEEDFKCIKYANVIYRP